ncbi:MAG TPA: glycosyltransferase [Longimicrobiales bacterium]|nr:glycosyltransferase [Longimicrobiales bacterium]
MLFAWILVGIAVFTILYAYALYPLTLALLARLRNRSRSAPPADWEWPEISITVPVYNEVGQVEDMLDTLLQLDYPRDRTQILVISDASDDGTDEKVQAYAHRGVELLRMPQRGGKTAAENAARPLLRGAVIVNTDASIRIDAAALKPMIARFHDPTVGLASGRDVSVTRVGNELNVGESTYVGYEMWVRDLETRVHGIVGASGCFYAIRRSLHQEIIPSALSRDFAAALITREHNLRPVTVNESVCYVPRVPSLKREYRRKVRTFTRGMETLYFKRALLNPLQYGIFSWMLFSHKVTRWFAPWAALLGGIGLLALSINQPLARIAVAAIALVFLLAALGWSWPEGKPIPRLLSIPAFMVAGNLAVMAATIAAMRGELNAVWEPTRRDASTRTAATVASR